MNGVEQLGRAIRGESTQDAGARRETFVRLRGRQLVTAEKIEVHVYPNPILPP